MRVTRVRRSAVDDPATLATFARHFETGEPIPPGLIRSMVRANGLNRAFQARQQMVLARHWAWMVLKIARIKVEVDGLEKISPDGSYVFAANHRSYMDTPVVLASILLEAGGKPEHMELAEPMLASALQKFPDDADLVYGVGMLRLLADRYPEAIAMLRQVVNRIVVDYRSGDLELDWKHGARTSVVYDWQWSGKRKGKRLLGFFV